MRAYVFFLGFHGRGLFSADIVKNMTLDEVTAYVKMLNEALMAENDARRKAAKAQEGRNRLASAKARKR